MFFFLSKVLGVFVQPVNLLALLMLAGLILRVTPWRRGGRILGGSAASVFVICCFSPIGALLMRGLEDRFPHPADTMPAPTGIIVLGGAVRPEITTARGEIGLNAAAPRLTTGVALALRYPAARLVFSGGSGDVLRLAGDEAKGAKALWLSLGIPESRMTFENRSRNTFENAIFTRDVLQPKPGETWLLVTSAWHMPRSIGIFRQAGFDVTAYPVDYRTIGDSRDWRVSRDALDSLDKLDTGLHEWVGLAAYWLTGKTNALFPAP